LIEIARRVHLNPNLVKQVLIDAGVEIRKGKPQKKGNPRIYVKGFMDGVANGIAPLYEKLKSTKFGSPEFNKLITMIIWSQGSLFFWPDNAYVTSLMISSLYDSENEIYIYSDMRKQFKKIVAMVCFDRSRTNKIVERIPAGSFASKALEFFNQDDKDSSLYFSFMEKRKKDFCKRFYDLGQDISMIDFINFLRDFSSDRYSEKHEVLINELKKQILNTAKVKDQASQELIIADTKLKDIHHDAMIVISRSSEFLEGFVDE
jgi:hypothetical protein